MRERGRARKEQNPRDCRTRKLATLCVYICGFIRVSSETGRLGLFLSGVKRRCSSARRRLSVRHSPTAFVPTKS
jgi:hypothetical protein